MQLVTGVPPALLRRMRLLLVVRLVSPLWPCVRDRAYLQRADTRVLAEHERA